MYAVAANCPELEVLTLGGYNEHVTDGGITILLEACKNLHTVKLSSKLLKVCPACMPSCMPSLLACLPVTPPSNLAYSYDPHPSSL